MIMDIMMWLQEQSNKYCDRDLEKNMCMKNVEKTVMSDQQLTSVLLQLDHMRAKNKYCRTVLTWAKEFDLTGRLIFQGKLIFILLQGLKSQVEVNIYYVYMNMVSNTSA